MRELSYEELTEAPSEIQYLYLAAIMKVSVGSHIIETSMSKYPEYFPDELERIRKWEKVPQHVHDEFNKAAKELHDRIFKDLPPSKGILWHCQNPDESEEWLTAYDKCFQEELSLGKALHDKFYGPYGL